MCRLLLHSRQLNFREQHIYSELRLHHFLPLVFCDLMFLQYHHLRHLHPRLLHHHLHPLHHQQLPSCCRRCVAPLNSVRLWSRPTPTNNHCGYHDLCVAFRGVLFLDGPFLLLLLPLRRFLYRRRLQQQRHLQHLLHLLETCPVHEALP